MVVNTIPVDESGRSGHHGAPDRPMRPVSDWHAAVQVERVTKRFGSTLALDDVSLSVEPGGVLALLGPNGPARPPSSGS